MKRLILIAVVFAAVGLSHETLTTTVLFGREIVRIADKHCVMCHAENRPSFPLMTYEQTWLQKRPIRADVIARHMPPWAAVSGYGQFANENSLTLRETQFVISWVEGLGPRNAGTVFTNTAAQVAPRPKEVEAHTDFGRWQLGQPQLTRQLPPNTIEPQANEVKRSLIDLGLTSERRLRALEFMPSDRRVIRAAFFTVQETGQWIGRWTPWYGFMSLPKGTAYRLPAGAHVAAEIHYRGVKERVVEQGTLGLTFADQASPNLVSDLVLDAKKAVTPRKFRAEIWLAADTYVVALRPEMQSGVKSIEVSARKPDGSTHVLLFAKDISLDWPTPYILKEPVMLPRGTVPAVTAYSRRVRLTASIYRARK
jgi:hypothetical protein